MKQFANHYKWSHVYTSLNNQAKENQPIICSKIPEEVPEEDIEAVLQELNYLYNFKDYIISRNNETIKGIKRKD